MSTAQAVMALAGGGVSLTLFAAAGMWWMEPSRRLSRALSRALEARPDALAFSPLRGRAIGMALDERRVAVVDGFDDPGLVFDLDELVGAELILDGQVAARAMRGEGEPTATGRDGLGRVSSGGIAEAERTVTVANGRPGISTLTLTVNGRPRTVALASGEERSLDISPELWPGTRNRIELVGLGDPGAEAQVTIWEGPGAAARMLSSWLLPWG